MLHPRALIAVTATLSLIACTSAVEQATTTDWRTPPLGLEAVEDQLRVPADNPLTDAKVALGKQLFFDPRLSSDRSMSCQSCHYHELGWSNGERFSKKVGGGENTRNSPTLYNLAYHDKLYWDGRAPSLEANIAAAWKGHMNDGQDTQARADELAAVPGYAAAFQAAFGEAPSSDNIAKALASFIRSLRGGDSKWDRYEKTKDASLVGADAIAGHALFMGKAGCVACHTPPLYTDRMFHAVGVGEQADVGRGKIEPDNELAQGAFKTPTLRSVAKSGPWFHDGSVATLREAVRIMASGGGDGPHFPKKDPLLVDRQLSDRELDQLVAFLATLDSGEAFTAPTLPE